MLFKNGNKLQVPKINYTPESGPSFFLGKNCLNATEKEGSAPLNITAD